MMVFFSSLNPIQKNYFINIKSIKKYLKKNFDFIEINLIQFFIDFFSPLIYIAPYIYLNLNKTRYSSICTPLHDIEKILISLNSILLPSQLPSGPLLIWKKHEFYFSINWKVFFVLGRTFFTSKTYLKSILSKGCQRRRC